LGNSKGWPISRGFTAGPAAVLGKASIRIASGSDVKVASLGVEDGLAVLRVCHDAQESSAAAACAMGQFPSPISP